MNIHAIPVIKRWIPELNLEKVLLAASICAFFFILFSMSKPYLTDVSASKKNKTIGDYKEKMRNFLGLHEEIQIPKQRIDDITLIDPQSIFMKSTVSNHEYVARQVNHSPFFPEESAQTIPGQKKEETMFEKEEQVFIGILNLIGSKNKLSVILKGATSGQYKTLLEGDTWDGIEIIAINPIFARIMNRKGQIQDYTTTPNGITVK